MNDSRYRALAIAGKAVDWLSRARHLQHGTVSVTAVVTVAVCISMTGFWTAYAENTRLQRTLQSKLPELVRPVLLNGFRLPLAEHVSPIQGSLVASGGEGALRLLIVSADSCPACVALMPRLTRLIDELPQRHGDDVVVLSYLGEKLPAELVAAAARRRIPVSIVRPVHRFDLFVHTGISSTPTIIVLDHSSRVRFVTNRLADPEIEWIVAYFSRERDASPITRSK